eukprot:TRINITY_DN74357_c0_g1_i1.p1 TRINITY_DN74357_c0_g1~~TRINITY_DN74357_c0_g1_i1.p1  ORF type:complete len:327 (+),score=32.55 TRINITY_DN74357_c0_g1_i1:120-1100(+)
MASVAQNPNAEDNVETAFAACCNLVGLGFGTFYWYFFIMRARAVDAQVQAVCVDSISGVDQASSRYLVGVGTGGSNYSYCHLPVSVFPCLLVGAHGECHRTAMSPISEQTFRKVMFDWGCDVNYGNDDDDGMCIPSGPRPCLPKCWNHAWSCKGSSCHAFERIALMCQESIRRDNYSCYVSPGSLDLGVDETPIEYPILYLLVSVISTVSFVCCFTWMCLSSPSIKAIADQCVHALCFFACCSIMIPALGVITAAINSVGLPVNVIVVNGTVVENGEVKQAAGFGPHVIGAFVVGAIASIVSLAVCIFFAVRHFVMARRLNRVGPG